MATRSISMHPLDITSRSTRNITNHQEDDSPVRRVLSSQSQFSKLIVTSGELAAGTKAQANLK